MGRALACLLTVLSLSAVASAKREKPRRSTRIIVCGPVIQGRSRDAVQLFERKQLPMRTIDLTPTSFRARILDER